MAFDNSGTIFDPRNDYNRKVLEWRSLQEEEPPLAQHKIKVTIYFDLEYDLIGSDIEELKEIAIDNAIRDIRRRSVKPDCTVAIEIDEDGEVID